MPSSTTTRKAPAKKAARKATRPAKAATAVAPPAPTLGRAHDPSDPLTQDLRVPSGAVCRAKRTTPEQLMMMGVIDQLDRLSAIVDEKHIKRVKRGTAAVVEEQVNVASLSKDPKSLAAVLGMADRVIEAVVVEPELVRPVVRDGMGAPLRFDAEGNEMPEGGHERPLPDDERVEGTVYTDTVQIDDKMFILNWTVGGSSDLDRFRRERDAFVADTGGVEGAAPSTE